MLFKFIFISYFALAMSPREIKMEARGFLEKHQFSESLKLTNQLVGVSEAEGLYLRAHIHLARGHFEEAVQDARRADELVPGSTSQLLLHNIAMNQEDYKKAVQYLDRARYLYDFTQPELLNKIDLAQLKYFFKTKKYKELIDFWRVHRFANFQNQATLLVARSHWKMGDAPLANELLDQILKEDRDAQYLLYRAKFSQDSAYKAKLLAEAEKTVRAELEDGLTGHRAELAQILIEVADMDSLLEATQILKTELNQRNTKVLRQLQAEGWGKRSRQSFQSGDYAAAALEKLKEFRLRLF